MPHSKTGSSRPTLAVPPSNPEEPSTEPSVPEEPRPQFDDPEPPAPRVRSAGRRTGDHIHQKGWWALVIGVLMQGGFMTMAWKLMENGADQVKAERESAQRQSDAYRLQLASQHRELVDVVRELAGSNKEIAKAVQANLDELHRSQDEAERTKTSLELERARLRRR